MLDPSFWVVTTGVGTLPPGVKVGIIIAKDPADAQAQLHASGQIGPVWAANFDYVLIGDPA